MSEVGARLGRLEGAFEGMRHSQNMLGVTIGIGFTIVVAILVFLGGYVLVRMDQLTDKVNDVPDKINAEMRDITRTLADSITAAKQVPPQVLLACLSG